MKTKNSPFVKWAKKSCSLVAVSFLLLHALPSAGQAAAQEAYKFKVDAFLLPTPHFLYMTKAAYRYADSLSKSA
ncbi:MAG: hypothetical protein LBK18_08995, partial [Prevotellaceae bacterium]|nr:hypothetical protein [Prevotellaceae bacterium]